MGTVVSTANHLKDVIMTRRLHDDGEVRAAGDKVKVTGPRATANGGPNAGALLHNPSTNSNTSLPVLPVLLADEHSNDTRDSKLVGNGCVGMATDNGNVREVRQADDGKMEMLKGGRRSEETEGAASDVRQPSLLTLRLPRPFRTPKKINSLPASISPSTSSSAERASPAASGIELHLTSSSIRVASPVVTCWHRFSRRMRTATTCGISRKLKCVSCTTRSSITPLDEREADTCFLLACAKEFLERLHEVERKIVLFYDAYDERDEHMATILELLGLQDHLYNELMRIQDMLAADDPDLERLRQYEHTHYMVVNVLRQLRGLPFSGGPSGSGARGRERGPGGMEPSASFLSDASGDDLFGSGPEGTQLPWQWHGHPRRRTGGRTGRSDVATQSGSVLSTAEKAIEVGGRQFSTGTLESGVGDQSSGWPHSGDQRLGSRAPTLGGHQGGPNTDDISGLLSSHVMETRVIRRWQQEERDKQQQRLHLKLANNMTRLRQQTNLLLNDRNHDDDSVKVTENDRET